MNNLAQFTTEYLSKSAGVYFVRQYTVIIALFVFGAIITDRLVKNASWLLRSTLAYPAGIAAFSVSAYIMLITGIPYNKWTVAVVIVAEAVAILVSGRNSYSKESMATHKKHMLVTIAFVLVLAAFATSGIAPVSISNDTMYFFRRYPDSIAYFGRLRDQFDFWLTDTGLGVVSIDTLPALFGFGESFGIREFFHINFLLFFGLSVYDRAKEKADKKGAVIAAVIVTAFLESATPFFILGHWALANMYFMEMFFIAAYTATRRDFDSSNITPILLLALALFRIEGTMFVVWLILCISLYTDMGKKLCLHCIVPMMVLFSGYCLKVFVQFYVLDNTYLFLTPQKAVLLVATMAAAGIYLVFICPRLPDGITGKLPALYIGALVAGNLVLAVRDTKLYTGNLAAFADNLFRQSGWGMLPYFVIAMTVLLAAEYVIARIKNKEAASFSEPFDVTLLVGFLLMVIAASYGRGDVLAEDVGDSGNRVLLQVVPLVTITYAQAFISLWKRDDCATITGDEAEAVPYSK